MKARFLRALALPWLFAVASPAAAAAQPTAGELPELRPLWTISNSDDCVSVHTDGEPWTECGFQSFTMNADASRVLTASQTGVIQLWDGAGRELRRIGWPDQPGGASGHSSARTAIVDNLGIAVVHQNQLAIIDLSDGRVLQQRVADDYMMIEALRPFGERLFAAAKDREWEGRAVEIALPSGDIQPVADSRDLARWGPGYYVTGTRGPVTIHYADGRGPVQSERPCMPLNERYCTWRDFGGRHLHLFDVNEARWRSFDTGRVLSNTDMAHVHIAGGRPYALLCGGGTGPVRDCSIVDLEARQELHRFPSKDWQAASGFDERGVPEIRVRVHTDDNEHGGRSVIRGVAVDGRVRDIDPSGQVRLAFSNNGLMLVPEGRQPTSILIGPDGRRLGRVPVPFYQNPGQLVGRRWLVPVAGPRAPSDNPEDSDTAVALFELPL